MLSDKNLPHSNTEEFKDIEGNIRSLNTCSTLADSVAKYREEIFGVLKNSEAEGSNDENKLNSLITLLNDKRTNLLWPNLGKSPDKTNCKFDFSNNDNLKSFWEKIIDARTTDSAGNITRDITRIDSSGKASDKDEKDLKKKIEETLKNLQFLHYDWQGEQQKWKLFGGKSTNITNVKNTLSDTYIGKLLNVDKVGDVSKAVDGFVSSVRKTSGNAFHIQHSKFKYLEEKETSIRIAGYLYLVRKVIDCGALTNNLYKEINNVLNSQIIKYEIPKLKGLHNVEKELSRLIPEYNTLHDLNENQGDVNLGDKDLSTGSIVHDINLKSDFEHGTTTDLERYEINASKIEIKDNNGHPLTVKLDDGAGSIPSLFAEIGNRKNADILIDVSGTDIKIGNIVIDNISGHPQVSIRFESQDSIGNQATNAGIALQIFPLDFSINLKGIKKVKFLGNASGKASLTKKYSAKLKVGSTPPPLPPQPNQPNQPTPPPLPPQPIEINASISDMGKDVLREKVALDVEERLRKEYQKIAKGNVLKRFKFFWKRGVYRNKMIKKKMKQLSGMPFTGDTLIDEQTSNATDRHQFEKDKGLDNNIKNINNGRNPVVFNNTALNDLCRRYLGGSVSDDQFKNDFNSIITSNTRLKKELDKAKITHMGTNILLKMKQQKSWRILIKSIQTNLDQYISTQTDSNIQRIKSSIKDHIKTFQDYDNQLVELFDEYQNDRADPAKLQSLKNYLDGEEARMNLGLSNLTVKLDIVKGGKSAYQINNKKRERLIYKLGNWMDKHPIWSGIGAVGAGTAIGIATGGLGPIATTIGISGLVGTTNFIKKHTHLTKEQKTHEKQLVSDYDNTMEKVREWQDTLSNGKWLSWKKYKAKRQLALYNTTTQNDLMISNDISNTINNLASNIGTLQQTEIDDLTYNLIEGWSRLKLYNKVGHNFLASKEKVKAEEDMNKLEKALLLGIRKLGNSSSNLQDIERCSANVLGSQKSFNEIYKEVKKNFKQSNRRFKRKRRDLSLKYGVTTAALSGGTAVAMQYATGTGMFAKGTNAVNGYTSGPKSLSDHFDLGKHELLDVGTQNNIYTGTKSTITAAPNGSEISIHYGGGTDATQFLPGRTPTSTSLATKITDVTNNINGMSGLTSADKATFIKEVSGLSGGSGTNGILQNMRQAEFLEQTARALADSGKSGDVAISLVHDSGLDVVGTHLHNASERVVNGSIAVLKKGVEAKPPIKGCFFGCPRTFNTYEEEKNAA